MREPGTLHDRSVVDPAKRALRALYDDLLNRVDLYWWSFPTGSDSATALRDYIFGSVHSAGSSLDKAAVALSLYNKMWTAQSTDMSRVLRATGDIYGDDALRPRMHERNVELEVHRLAFFVSLGASLDSLASTAIGVLGIAVPVIRADLMSLTDRDWRDPKTLDRVFKRTDDAVRALQRSRVAELRAALKHAGPDGWLWWMLDMRNTLVHRENRVDFTNATGANGRLRFDNVLPRRPELSNIEALKDSTEGMPEYYLSEHAGDTKIGLLQSTATATSVIAEVLREGWRDRSDSRPTVDWEAQWREPRPSPGFNGYAPGTSVMNPKGGSIHMGPDQVRRLKEAGIITPPR